MLAIDVEKWGEIYQSLSAHKLRTFLTAFGVFWGIFMLVILLGAGQALEKNALQDFGGLKNVVFFSSGQKTTMAYDGLSKGRTIDFKDEDVMAIRQSIKGVDVIVPVNSVGSQFTVRKTKNDSYQINGAFPETQSMYSLKLIDGRFINDMDGLERRKVAVIGSRVLEVLFNNDENPIGEFVEIQGIFFQVVGVYKSIVADGGASANEQIYIPNDTLRYSFNQRGIYQRILFTPKEGVSAAKIEKEILSFLKKRHKVHPNDPAPISTFNMEDRYLKFKSLFVGIAVFSWAVAIGTVFAGAVGVGNIMLIVVKERTREIGIRKALGATPRSIILMIVQESLVITLFAGYLGLVFGVFLLEVIGGALEKASDGGGFFSNIEISFSTALIGLLVLVVSGVLAALLPAKKAATVDPVLALQSE